MKIVPFIFVDEFVHFLNLHLFFFNKQGQSPLIADRPRPGRSPEIPPQGHAAGAERSFATTHYLLFHNHIYRVRGGAPKSPRRAMPQEQNAVSRQLTIFYIHNHIYRVRGGAPKSPRRAMPQERNAVSRQLTNFY